MRLLIPGLILIAGCDQPTPLEAECEPGQRTVSFFLFDSETELRNSYTAITGQNADGVDGFTAYRGGQTEVYLTTLRHQNDNARMYVWGHELAHVVCGQWHGDDHMVSR